MSEITGGTPSGWQLVGCMASAVGLACAFVGLGAATGGLGAAALAVGLWGGSLASVVISCD